MDKPSMLKPTLIGGSVFGLLGALPIISALNCACCALILSGGFLAAYLQSNQCKQVGVAFRAGDGATVGVVAGLFYAIVNSIVQGLLSIVVGQPDLDAILDQIESGGAPPEVLDTVEQVFEVMSGPMGVLISLGVGIVLALVFSTIGGLIGGAVFKFEAPPAAPPSSSAPPPPAGVSGSEP